MMLSRCSGCRGSCDDLNATPPYLPQGERGAALHYSKCMRAAKTLKNVKHEGRQSKRNSPDSPNSPGGRGSDVTPPQPKRGGNFHSYIYMGLMPADLSNSPGVQGSWGSWGSCVYRCGSKTPQMRLNARLAFKTQLPNERGGERGELHLIRRNSPTSIMLLLPAPAGQTDRAAEDATGTARPRIF